MSKTNSEMTTATREAIAEARRQSSERRATGTIKLPLGYTLEPLDDRNWAMCDKDGPVAYWSSLEQALRGVSRKLTDKALRGKLSGDTLLTLADKIAEVQAALVKELRRGVQI